MSLFRCHHVRVSLGLDRRPSYWDLDADRPLRFNEVHAAHLIYTRMDKVGTPWFKVIKSLVSTTEFVDQSELNDLIDRNRKAVYSRFENELNENLKIFNEKRRRLANDLRKLEGDRKRLKQVQAQVRHELKRAKSNPA